jgi:hypothetical protein
MRHNQTVAEMAREVLSRQAAARAEQTGEPFAEVLEAVLETVAGRQLRELESGAHRHRTAQEWQDGLARERLEVRLKYFVGTDTSQASGASSPPADSRCSWMEDFLLERLEGKEGREEYYARLEQEWLGSRKG